MKLRAAIVGPTGYTGHWLIELLLRHPNAEIAYLASGREQLPIISDEFPALSGRCDLPCQPIDAPAMGRVADVAFVALPHKAAMEQVPALLDAGLKVIDLSADYRLSDQAQYEQTYQTPHTDPDNLAQAVYGLPELYAERIASARLVANPGCYPTASALAIAPLLRKKLIQPTGIVINAASGVSGAGRSPKPHLHYPEMTESYSAYACGNHRHQPEIEQTLSKVAGTQVQTLFIPHLLPIERGILATITMDPAPDKSEDDFLDAFQEAYADQPFVRPRAGMPNVKHVRQSNFCDLSLRLAGGKVVVFSAIDNMIKGASGQAVQNMNLMFGLDQTTGLL